MTVALNSTARQNGAGVKKIDRDVELAFVKYSRYWYMNRQPKLSMDFTIMEPGDDFGNQVQAHYRLARIDKRRRCYAGRSSRIVRDFGRLFPDYIDKMPLPLSRLDGCSVLARVRLVEIDGNEVPIARQQQYEVVDYIKGRTNG